MLLLHLLLLLLRLHLLLLLLGGHDELMVIGEEVTIERRSLRVLMMMAAVKSNDGSPQDDTAEVLHSSARQMVRMTRLL